MWILINDDALVLLRVLVNNPGIYLKGCDVGHNTHCLRFEAVSAMLLAMLNIVNW